MIEPVSAPLTLVTLQQTVPSMWMLKYDSLVLESSPLGLAVAGTGTLCHLTFLYYQMRNYGGWKFGLSDT